MTTVNDIHSQLKLLSALSTTPWAIRQKQTGADRLSLGGAIARTKVARAAVALEWLSRFDSSLVQSTAGAAGLCIPRPTPGSEEPVPAVEAIPS